MAERWAHPEFRRVALSASYIPKTPPKISGTFQPSLPNYPRTECGSGQGRFQMARGASIHNQVQSSEPQGLSSAPLQSKASKGNPL
jgi:hypothetical protein